jgi:hypothetical protein
MPMHRVHINASPKGSKSFSTFVKSVLSVGRVIYYNCNLISGYSAQFLVLTTSLLFKVHGIRIDLRYSPCSCIIFYIFNILFLSSNACYNNFYYFKEDNRKIDSIAAAIIKQFYRIKRSNTDYILNVIGFNDFTEAQATVRD